MITIRTLENNSISINSGLIKIKGILSIKKKKKNTYLSPKLCSYSILSVIWFCTYKDGRFNLNSV